METEIYAAIDRFSSVRIGVVGDVMLDHYMWGDADRISPEAPVPIILMRRETFALGGAGNVASNIASLGGKVSLAGLIGDDDAGATVEGECKRLGIHALCVRDVSRPTTQKMRIIAGRQQVLRVDREVRAFLRADLETLLTERLLREIPKWDAVVFSDYAKGTLTQGLVETVVRRARELGRPIIGDLKPVNFALCEGMTIVAPNRKEALEASGKNTVGEAGHLLQKKFGCTVLVTRGEEGVSLFEQGSSCDFKAGTVDVADATGAGDTVTAVLALSLAAGLSLQEAASLANIAGGIVVRKVGVAAVSPDELKRCIGTYTRIT